jgi:hypothetical protein
MQNRFFHLFFFLNKIYHGSKHTISVFLSYGPPRYEFEIGWCTQMCCNKDRAVSTCISSLQQRPSEMPRRGSSPSYA